jgi:hypothetical protein
MTEVVKKIKRKPFLLILGLLILAGILSFIGYTRLLPADDIALAAMESTDQVQVSDQPMMLVLVPRVDALNRGFVFYPGARVDPQAYVPMLKPLAEAGILVVIPKMPLGFAVLGIDRAAEIQAVYPQILCWAIGGHSLGGSMAAEYVAKFPEEMQGIVFVASYPARNTSLASLPIRGLVISGSLDGLVAAEDVASVETNFPQESEFVLLEGANHAQFGHYGPQSGDNLAEMSAEEQRAKSTQAMLDFFSNLRMDCGLTE